MSKLPVLMRGTEGNFDYILLAIKGNVSLGVKIAGLDLSAFNKDEGQIDLAFRVRSAVQSDEYITRLLGHAPTEQLAPHEAFPGSWTKVDAGRASFMYNTKKAVGFTLLDDGSWPAFSELGENLTRMIGGLYEHIPMPEDAIVLTTTDDLAEHLVKLMYPAFMNAYGIAAHNKFADMPMTKELVSGSAGLADYSGYGGAVPSLEDAAAELTGEDDPDADDDADDFDDVDDPDGSHDDDDAPLEDSKKTSSWDAGSASDFEEGSVTKFPGKDD